MTSADDKKPRDINEYRKNLVCLVPHKSAATKDSWLLTSHEKTLCDCQVLEIFAAYDALLREVEELRKFSDSDQNAKNARWAAQYNEKLIAQNDQLKEQLAVAEKERAGLFTQNCEIVKASVSKKSHLEMSEENKRLREQLATAKNENYSKALNLHQKEFIDLQSKLASVAEALESIACAHKNDIVSREYWHNKNDAALAYEVVINDTAIAREALAKIKGMLMKFSHFQEELQKVIPLAFADDSEEFDWSKHDVEWIYQMAFEAGAVWCFYSYNKQLAKIRSDKGDE